MNLWPHQARGLVLLRDACREYGRVLVVASCGSGKTVLGAEVCAGASRLGNRVLWVAHQTELIDQPVAEFQDRYGLSVGIIQAARPKNPGAPIQVATIQTLSRREIPTGFDIIIFDEAHLHVGTKTPQRIIDANPEAQVIGLTGTPTRLDGTGMKSVYRKMIQLAQPSELIEAGILVRPRVFGSEKGPDLSKVHTVDGDYNQMELEDACMKASLLGDIAKTFRKRAFRPDGSHLSAILFGSSVAHSKACRDALVADGVNAIHLDADTHADERRAMLGRLRSGEPIVICNVRVLTTGFDYRGLECLIDAGPTKSLSLFIQKQSRVLRSAPGKTSALILDHACNIKGRQDSHGMPHADRNWTMDGIEKKDRELIPSLRTCPECFAIFPPAPACPECGHAFDVNPREIRETDGDLDEVVHAPTLEERKDAFYTLCETAVKLRMGRGFVISQYKSKFGMQPRFEWPPSLPEDLANKRRILERVAESRGYSARWVELRMAEGKR